MDADNTAETAEQVFSSAFTTWEMAWQLLSLPANSISNPHLFCAVRYGENPGAGNHDEMIKGIGSVLGFDLSSLSLNAMGGFISLLI